MKIHADLGRRAVVDSTTLDWVDSPLPGVRRKMLERDGEEVARATSLVSYAPHSSFSAHVHGGGEEFLVLEGTFTDEHGDYPPGTYVRNPPGSRHEPGSRLGCTILVKLSQMRPDDDEHVVVDTRSTVWRPGATSGHHVLPLHSDEIEEVTLWRLDPGTELPLQTWPGGEEIFVLEGVLEDELGRYPEGTWLRNPPSHRSTRSSSEGCTLFRKTGHLHP